MGEQVEFIPYSVLKNLRSPDIKTIFHLQNEVIINNGAIAIQGIPENIMTAEIETDQTLLQWFLDQPHIQQVKKSDTPGVQKWWIITKKDQLETVIDYLNHTVHSKLQFFRPTEQNYTPPAD